jgi:hypothetical protein
MAVTLLINSDVEFSLKLILTTAVESNVITPAERLADSLQHKTQFGNPKKGNFRRWKSLPKNW